MELLTHVTARIYPVGRLDLETEGALLLTNDGELALRLTHPRYGVAKVYEARVEGDPSDADLDKVRRGLFLEGRKTAPARVQVVRRSHRHATLKVEIHEGRKREIRKLFEAIGYPVADLTRIEFAGLTLEGLRRGQWRFLHTAEVRRLKKLVGLESGDRPPATATSSSSRPRPSRPRPRTP